MNKNEVDFVLCCDYCDFGYLQYNCPNCNKLYNNYDVFNGQESTWDDSQYPIEIICDNCKCKLHIIKDDGDLYIIRNKL